MKALKLNEVLFIEVLRVRLIRDLYELADSLPSRYNADAGLVKKNDVSFR